jgi:chemotaxis protein methyltransferase CheR
VLPELWDRAAEIRLWSAGCSTGEEPYTLAIVLLDLADRLGAKKFRILATDLSERVLARARAAVYPAAAGDGLPRSVRERFFEPVSINGAPGYRVAASVRRMVSFARLNLIDRWPMRGPFDVILCRNVMIYFDRPTQLRLVERFGGLLPPGAHLMIGHSETLASAKSDFEYVMPATYRRKAPAAQLVGAGR